MLNVFDAGVYEGAGQSNELDQPYDTVDSRCDSVTTQLYRQSIAVNFAAA